ncbi:putative acyltransferase yihG [Escherichia coli P12b]|nr:putative acyltransferase yihG [Escherichia coli P12b]
MMYCWCEGLAVLLHLNPHLQWEVHGLEGLSKKNWYLLICNHRSWADIVVLCVLFRKHIPMNKYFLKQQLAWVPFLGLACWSLDMPFMKRYSRAIYYVIRSDVVKMLKPLGVLVKSFACIPPPLSISLKAPVSRKKNISKPTPLFKTCCHQRRQALRWR